MNANAERGRHLQRVDDVQIMRPGLGKILPGVRRRVRADEIVLPVGRRTLLVMALQGGGVILAFVAEERAERVVAALAGDEQIPSPCGATRAPHRPLP